MKYEAAVEAILFSAGQSVPAMSLAESLEMEIDALNILMQEMIEQYDREKRGVQIIELDGAYQMCTRPDYYEYIRRVQEPKRQNALSSAALEALAIIAYNQPATKSQVEYIRGVDCTGSINRLMERGLIDEAGRLDTPGKPILYQTTEEFLRCFGLKSLAELPSLEEVDLSILSETLNQEIKDNSE